MTLIEAMQQYLMQCPVLTKQESHLEFTADEENWALYDGGEAVIEQYWDGSELRCHRFSLAVRRFACDDGERRENITSLQTLCDWLSQRQLSGILPALPKGKQAERIESQNAALSRMDEDSVCGTYHMQLLLYYEERREVIE